MKESKEQVERAVITIGESLGLGDNIKAILDINGLYTTIREVIYLSFVANKIEYFEEDNYVYNSYQLIRKYCKEMKMNGQVDFDK